MDAIASGSSLISTSGQDVWITSEDECLKFWFGWLSQFPHVFDTLDVTEGRENFCVIQPPSPFIETTTRRHECLAAFFNLCDGKPSVEGTPPLPTYLFFYPLPTSISELVPWMSMNDRFYFWSFDETAFTLKAYANGSATLRSWPTHVYTALQDWQKARGFDPSTTDWERELGYPKLEIIGTRKDQAQLEEAVVIQRERKTSSSWWEAFTGSGISAVGL
ncbi:hypothetical protein WG66_008247 [Moniliophthora roreri]|nr:hypothetical protein WG66_008247 [Moniliophthora roreri]